MHNPRDWSGGVILGMLQVLGLLLAGAMCGIILLLLTWPR